MSGPRFSTTAALARTTSRSYVRNMKHCCRFIGKVTDKEHYVAIDRLVPTESLSLKAMVYDLVKAAEKSHDKYKIKRLMGLAKAHIPINPIVVNAMPHSNGKYEILDGHHRVVAALLLGVKLVPVIFSTEEYAPCQK